MKNIYTMSEADLKVTEKEFKKTAYGKRLYNIKVGVVFVSFAFVILMLLGSFSDDEARFISIFKDGIYWLGLLIGMVSETIAMYKWNHALKEYIESKKD